MNDSEVFNILSRIHVILRREANRITDIEWARVNREYAREVVHLCGQLPHPDLPGLASRLVALLELNGSATSAKLVWSSPAPMEYETDLHESAEKEARYLSGLR